jgi:hypothetical protein
MGKIQANEIKTPYVKSEDQLVDVFTKTLDSRKFQDNINMLGMINVFTPNLRGSVKNNWLD